MKKLIGIFGLMAILTACLSATAVLAVPEFYSNASSTPTNFNPDTNSQFNITLNDSVNNMTIDTVFIELNWTGTTANYSMTNATFGDMIYTYTAAIGSKDNATQFWNVFANNTTDDWAAYGEETFIIIENQTNLVNLNLTYETKATLNANMSEYVDSDKLLTADGYFTYSNSGTITLFLDGAAATDGETRIHTTGVNKSYKANATGNYNYTSNATGVTYYFTVVQAGGGGSAGVGGGLPPAQSTPGVTQQVQGDAWALPSFALPSVDSRTLVIVVIVIIAVVSIIVKKRH